MYDNVWIGNQLRVWRKHVGMSQEKLAVRVGYSRASIANIEAGKQTLSVVDALTICRVLGIDVCSFLCSLPRRQPWMDAT